MIVKICGITNAADALAAAEAGAAAIGFVFYPASPRYIPPSEAARIAVRLPGAIWKAGVFVNETAENIARTAAEAGLDIAQLYGDCGGPETLRIWRQVKVSPGFRADSAAAGDAEAFVLETASPLYGGTGAVFDWTLARGFPGRFLIAGGLDETNVREAIGTAQPWGVDASSRLETAPGRKDHARVRAFVQAALAAAVEVR